MTILRDLYSTLFIYKREPCLKKREIGSVATKLIHIGQAVMGMEDGLDYFFKTVFNYPTLAGCYKVAALDAYNKLHD